MASLFVITTPANTVPLNPATRRSEASFTVSNASGRPIQGRALVVPQDPATAAWFTLVGDAERSFSAGGTQQYTVQIAVPPTASAGRYPFRLDMVGVTNPDEDFTQGPSVTFETPAPVAVAVKKPFPWWIVVVALVVLLVGGGLFAVVRSRADADAQRAALAQAAQQTVEAQQAAANATATAQARAAGNSTATAQAAANSTATARAAVTATALAIAARPTATPVPPTATPQPTNTPPPPPTATPRPVQWEVSMGRIDDDAYLFVNGTQRHHQGDGSIRININQWLRPGDNEVEIVLRNGNCFATRGDFALFRDGTAVWNRTIDRSVSTCGRQYDVKFLVNFQTGAWSKTFEDDTAQA